MVVEGGGECRGRGRQWDLLGRSCKVSAFFTSPLRLSDATPPFRMTPQCPPGSLVCRLAFVVSKSSSQYPPSDHPGLTRQDPRESLSPVIRGTTPPTERGPGGHTLCACTGPLWKTIESSGSSRSALCAMVLVPWHGVILHGPWGHRLTAISPMCVLVCSVCLCMLVCFVVSVFISLLDTPPAHQWLHLPAVRARRCVPALRMACHVSPGFSFRSTISSHVHVPSCTALPRVVTPGSPGVVTPPRDVLAGVGAGPGGGGEIGCGVGWWVGGGRW